MKNIKRKAFAVLAFASIFAMFGCGGNATPSTTTTESDRIEEDLTKPTIVDDNYRNYYEIFVRSFYDSNGDGIGDLNGVTKKLDYIADLGYTGIWLMPINPSPSYHKYNVSNYYTVDSAYGTVDDLKNLISECHKRNIKLIIDLVLNHSSKECSYYSKAVNAHEKQLNGQSLTEEENQFKDFYTFYDKKADIPSTVKAHQVQGKSFYYEGNFDSDMPEFNWDSQYVRTEFKKVIEYYMDMGLDGFRLDAVKYFYLNKTSKNVEVLSKIKQWANAKNPKSYIVGEMWEFSEDLMKSYYSSGIDSFFNFYTSTSSGSNGIINSINQEGRQLGKYYDALVQNNNMAGSSIAAPFLDNHDMRRYSSQVSEDKNKFYYGLLQMMNGTTFTYYGDEAGMVGTNSGNSNPDENVRIPIKWGEDEGQCSDLPGATAANYPYGTVKFLLLNQNSTLNYYKKCLLIRNQNPEIARGTVSVVKQDKENSLLFIKKTYDGKSVGIIINFSQTDARDVDFSDSGFTQVVGQLVANTKTDYIKKTGEKSINLPAFSIAIVR